MREGEERKEGEGGRWKGSGVKNRGGGSGQ